MDRPSQPPTITKELLAYLERLYPDKAPDRLEMRMSEVWFNAGRVSVVRKLRDLYEKQPG